MYADGIFLREEFVEAISIIPNDALRVFLILLDRQRMNTKVGLSLTELSRATDLGLESCGRALLWLADPNTKTHPTKEGVELAAFIEIEQKSRYFVIKISEFWRGGSTETGSIPFTYDVTDATKISTLEKELRRLSTMRITSSGLTGVLKGEEQRIVGEMERDLGRGLSTTEAYLVGKIIQGYNPERVQTLWRQNAARTPNPIRAIYAMLLKGKLGKGAPKSDANTDEVVYKRLAL